ncbi:MAG: flagellar hook-basal body complex protein, partial [Planctomycetes bacterium]|nr:flagellar hook-basal body complex protein [Planctomycetota bacterium]
SGPQGALGGINAKQIGLGAVVSEIQRSFRQGSLEATGVATDLAVDGDGFFIVKDSLGQNAYTRAGSFTLNPQNLLHNAANGMIVQGYMADFDTFQVPSGGPLSNINIPLGALTISKSTTNASFEGNLNAAGSLSTLGSVLESQQLFATRVASGNEANENTLLIDLVRSTTGTATGNTVDVGISIGDRIELTAEKGGRTINRTFEVGAPPPFGGNTLGDLRDFLQGTLGIAVGNAPGQELISSVRQTPNAGQAAQTFLFNPGAPDFAAAADEAFVLDPTGSGANRVFFFFDGDANNTIAAGFGATIGDTVVQVTKGGTIRNSLTNLAAAINAQATAGAVVNAQEVQIGPNEGLVITALQSGPNGNAVRYNNSLITGAVTNQGAGNLVGGTRAVDVNGTIDLQGDAAARRIRFVPGNTFTLTAVGAAGDTVTIVGTTARNFRVQAGELTAGSGATVTLGHAAPLGNTVFTEGAAGANGFAGNAAPATAAQNLANAINSHPNLAGKVTASVVTLPSGAVHLVFTPSVAEDNAFTATSAGAGAVAAMTGQSIKTNNSSVTLTAGTDFAVGATASATMANLSSAINNNTLLNTANGVQASIVAMNGSSVLALLPQGAGDGTVTFQASAGLTGFPAAATTIRSGLASLTAGPGGTLNIATASAPGSPQVTITASATGPTNAQQFKIEALGGSPAENLRLTLLNLANAINANSTLAPILNAAVEQVGSAYELVLAADATGVGGNDILVVGNTLASSAFTPAAGETAPLPTGNVKLTGGGTNRDTVSIIRSNSDGTVDVALTDKDLDFLATGVRVGDFIRFGSGEAAGQIAKVTAVGVDTTQTPNAVNINRLEFKMLATADVPTLPGGQTWFIHEAAQASVGSGSKGETAPGVDPTSPRGSLRVAGNVGKANEIRNLNLFKVATSGERTLISSFTELTAAKGESTFTRATVYDSLGIARDVDLTVLFQGSSDKGTTWRWIAESDANSANPGVDLNRVVGTGIVEFDRNGKFVRTVNDSVSVNLAATGATPTLVFGNDFSNVTAFASEQSNADAQQGAGTSEIFLADQDGFEQGTLRDFSMAVDGMITGAFTNGLTRTLGRLAVARFNNNGGLIDVGGNGFREGVNSGPAQIGVAGLAGRGLIKSGFLEESNVDLAETFTELIVAQRAFQANARSITTSDMLLTELVNLVR